MARLLRRWPTRPAAAPRALVRFALALLALCMPLLAAAQEQGLEIDIVGGNAAALPITVVPFGGTAGGTDIGAVVRSDLARPGQFRRLR